MKYNIAIIGAGNLATHLSKALRNQGHNIVQVYSRTEKSAKTLSNILETEYASSPTQITLCADLYFVALKDSVFADVLGQVDFKNKLLVHCSGSLPLSILQNYSENTGVLYPLQTFSKSRELDFSKVPLFVEANSLKNEKTLVEIANSLSNTVSVLNSEKRKSLHISAVLACNFVNHMYTLAGEFLSSKDIPFDVLEPLIEETAQKVQDMNPKTAQTGPAVRFDENIINDHLNHLSVFPNTQELYKSISKSIFETHQEKYI